jgi:hypothetical protein
MRLLTITTSEQQQITSKSERAQSDAGYSGDLSEFPACI